MKAEHHDDIHKSVSDSYARAIERSKTKGGAASCCSSKKPAGNAAKLVDYADAEGLPEEALGSSFGCGNPLAFSEVREGETVVDLGSGAGLDLLLASRKVGPTGRVIGVDMTDAMLDEARRNIERAGATNVEVRKGIIEALPLEDSSVDWVISNCVINLSPDKPAVFAELARVLKPGGRISVSDIVVEALPQFLREQAAVHSACIGGAISEAEYTSGLDAAGLVDVKVTERLVYEEETLLDIVALDEESARELEVTGLSRDEIRSAVHEVTGKVWSAKFTARKPGA